MVANVDSQRDFLGFGGNGTYSRRIVCPEINCVQATTNNWIVSRAGTRVEEGK